MIQTLLNRGPLAPATLAFFCSSDMIPTHSYLNTCSLSNVISAEGSPLTTLSEKPYDGYDLAYFLRNTEHCWKSTYESFHAHFCYLVPPPRTWAPWGHAPWPTLSTVVWCLESRRRPLNICCVQEVQVNGYLARREQESCRWGGREGFPILTFTLRCLHGCVHFVILHQAVNIYFSSFLGSWSKPKWLLMYWCLYNNACGNESNCYYF